MRFTHLAVLGLLVWSPACGSAASSCGTTAACGGDVVGDWVPAGSCVNRSSLQSKYMMDLGMECPSGTSVSILDATSDWAKISAKFNADGSYSATTTFSTSVQILVPPGCLVTRSCADVDAALRAMVDPVTGIVAASCRNADQSCACVISQQQPTSSVDGTYTISGTMMTTTPAGGGPTETPYCVRESKLHLLAFDPSGNGAIASDIVLMPR